MFIQSNLTLLTRSTINVYTVKSRYLEVDGTIFYKFKLPKVQINAKIMVGESNQNVFFIQKDALRFAEFEISEFEI